MSAPETATAEASVRLDKWLWAARFCKSRALAQKVIDRGQVRVNGAVAKKPSASVRVGQIMTLTLGPVRRTVTVTALGFKRGSATDARTLYDEPSPPEKLKKDEAALPTYKPLLSRPKGAGRPTKRDRRAIARTFGGHWEG
ncbi:MAG: RNA-binding S4 domain-containing protein [Rhodobacteraceae bacterium]|nr:RNA-binding S4 domain-containing protein [Paracoccaceae bacterium]